MKAALDKKLRAQAALQADEIAAKVRAYGDPRALQAVVMTGGKGARDLRSEARRQIDRVWEGLATDTYQRFGRSPSPEAADQPTAQLAAALAAAHAAETAYLRLAADQNVSAAAVAAAFDRFATACAFWATEATRGWESAREHAARAKRETEWWVRR